MPESNEQEPKEVQLVYASAATTEFNQESLDQLLEISRTNNAKVNVTGVLLYVEGTFFQVLEGGADTVQEVYDKISLDKRHNNVLLLSRREIEERNFADWSMGFIRSQREVSELPGFVDYLQTKTFLDLKGDSERMEKILDGFRRGQWRRTADPVGT